MKKEQVLTFHLPLENQGMPFFGAVNNHKEVIWIDKYSPDTIYVRKINEKGEVLKGEFTFDEFKKHIQK